MIQLLTFRKKKVVDNVIFTENSVREEVMRRSIVNTIAKKAAVEAKSKPTEKMATKPNQYAPAIAKLDEILDKVSGYENSKIAAVAELALALETGDFKNLIKLLKTKDKVIRVKQKKY